MLKISVAVSFFLLVVFILNGYGSYAASGNNADLCHFFQISSSHRRRLKHSSQYLPLSRSSIRLQNHAEQRERFAHCVPIVLLYHLVFRGVTSAQPAPDT